MMSSRSDQVIPRGDGDGAAAAPVAAKVRDIVSFSLWRRLIVTPRPTHTAPLDGATLKDIIKIVHALTVAARRANREPPEFELNIILLPDERSEYSVHSWDYQTALGQLIGHTKVELISQALMGGEEIHIDVCDAYTHLNDEEIEYLDGLKAAGSAADMAKNKAIFRHRHRKHLQIDTNTKIPDFQELYDRTFGHLNSDNYMRFNASYYDESGQYVSVHNKAVYFTSGNPASIAFGESLQEIMTAYCKTHKADLADKIAIKNSIYSKVFCEAVYRANLSLKAEFIDNGDRKIRFVANILACPEEFGLTSIILTALNRTWASDSSSPLIRSRQLDTSTRYKSMPAANFMATTADYQVWENVVKKFFMECNQKMSDFTPLNEDGQLTSQVIRKEQYIERYRSISNSARELEAAAAFICNPTTQEHPLFYHALLMGFEHKHNLYQALGINNLSINDVEVILEAIETRFEELVAQYDSVQDQAALEMPANLNDQFLAEAVTSAEEQHPGLVAKIRAALAIRPDRVGVIQHRTESGAPIGADPTITASATAAPDSVSLGDVTSTSAEGAEDRRERTPSRGRR